MSFDDLPPLPPLIYPEAQGYAERISAASRRVQGDARCVLDVAYGADYWQKLDIYLPEPAPIRPVPVLLFLHGGAWLNGCKEWMGFMAPAITSLPAIFVAPSYRHAPETRYPGPVDDCRGALAWVWNNIADLGGDPDRLFYGGHSAGGHLCSQVALRRDLLEAAGLPRDVVKACFPVSGVFDLRPDVEGAVSRGIVDKFLADPGQAEDASPISWTDGNTTPFHVAYGERDHAELIVLARRMIAALERGPAPVTWEAFDGYNHFDTNEKCDSADHPWVRNVLSRMAEREPLSDKRKSR